MGKFFVINEEQNELSKEEISSIELEKQQRLKQGAENRLQLNEEKKKETISSIKHVHGRIIIVINVDGKNSHTFEDGTKIYLGRQFNNLNRRETEPVNATVIDSEYIPKGSEILIHPNSIHDSNRIFNYANISVEAGNDIRYYSIEEASAFIFRDGNEWKALRGFVTALRVFKPYSGMIAGIKPLQIKDVLYITSDGEFKNKIVHTLRACDYEIIFQNQGGREDRIIRCRHYDYNHDREEIIAIRNDLTELFENEKLLIGLSISDCKTYKEIYG